MNRGTAQILSIGWKAAIVLLTLQVVASLSARYLTGSEAAPEFILGNAFANPFLIIHVLSGAVALRSGRCSSSVVSWSECRPSTEPLAEPLLAPARSV